MFPAVKRRKLSGTALGVEAASHPAPRCAGVPLQQSASQNMTARLRFMPCYTEFASGLANRHSISLELCSGVVRQNDERAFTTTGYLGSVETPLHVSFAGRRSALSRTTAVHLRKIRDGPQVRGHKAQQDSVLFGFLGIRPIWRADYRIRKSAGKERPSSKAASAS